jgi:hypothetical protein
MAKNQRENKDFFKDFEMTMDGGRTISIKWSAGMPTAAVVAFVMGFVLRSQLSTVPSIFESGEGAGGGALGLSGMQSVGSLQQGGSAKDVVRSKETALPLSQETATVSTAPVTTYDAQAPGSTAAPAGAVTAVPVWVATLPNFTKLDFNASFDGEYWSLGQFELQRVRPHSLWVCHSCLFGEVTMDRA